MTEATPRFDLASALLEDPESGPTWRRLTELGPSDADQLLTDLKRHVDELARKEPQRALGAARCLVRAADELGRGRALALRGLASALFFAGHAEEAAREFERVVELHLEAGEEVEAARARRSLVEILQKLGHTSEALTIAALARPVLERAGEQRLLAQLEVNLGNLHVRLDEYPAARRHYSAARALFDALGDAFGIAVSDFNRAVTELNADLLGPAQQAWTDARRTFEALGLEVPVADCDYHLAYLESRVGRLGASLEGLLSARRRYEANGKPDGVPLCDLDLAEVHLRMGLRRDALRLARSAAAAFEALGLRYEQAKSEALAGLALSELGLRAEADDELGRAAERFRSLGNAVAAAVLEIQRAGVLAGRQLSTPAEARLREARHVVEARGLALPAGLATVALARFHLARRAPADALRELAPLVEPRAEDDPLDLLLSAKAFRVRAEAHRALADIDASVEALKHATRAIETAYSGLGSRDARLAFFGTHHDAFEELAMALAGSLSRSGALEALSVIERGRARSLREVPAEARTPSAEERAARERLDWLLARRLDAELGAGAIEHDLRSAAPATAVLRDAQERVAAFTRGTAAPRALADEGTNPVGTGVVAGEVALVYLVTTRGALVWVLEEGRIHQHTLDLDRERLRSLRDRVWLHLERSLGSPDREPMRVERALRAVLAEAGKLLLGPVQEHLDGRPLLVVPYGDMHDLPFPALQSSGRVLLERCDIGHAVSIGDRRRRRRPASPLERVIVVGVEAERLPGIAEEVRAVSTTHGKRSERRPGPALQELLAPGIAMRGILHIATHGLFEASRPSFSSLCLGESFLLAREVEGWNLDIDLVVLSGCHTGRHRRIPGEDLVGLPQAFLRAGARAVIGNLWPVHDEDAVPAAQTLHRDLARGLDARAAHSHAMRSLREQHPSSVRWAGSILLGDPTTAFPPTI